MIDGIIYYYRTVIFWCKSTKRLHMYKWLALGYLPNYNFQDQFAIDFLFIAQSKSPHCIAIDFVKIKILDNFTHVDWSSDGEMAFDESRSERRKHVPSNDNDNDMSPYRNFIGRLWMLSEWKAQMPDGVYQLRCRRLFRQSLWIKMK